MVVLHSSFFARLRNLDKCNICLIFIASACSSHILLLNKKFNHEKFPYEKQSYWIYYWKMVSEKQVGPKCYFTYSDRLSERSICAPWHSATTARPVNLVIYKVYVDLQKQHTWNKRVCKCLWIACETTGARLSRLPCSKMFHSRRAKRHGRIRAAGLSSLKSIRIMWNRKGGCLQ